MFDFTFQSAMPEIELFQSFRPGLSKSVAAFAVLVPSGSIDGLLSTALARVAAALADAGEDDGEETAA